MPTLESDIAKHVTHEELVRLLKAHVERSLECSKVSNYWDRWLPCHRTAFHRHVSGFVNGAASISLFPSEPKHIQFLWWGLPSNTESIHNDWAAVSHDLVTALLKYALEQHEHGRSTESESEPEPERTVSGSIRSNR